VTLSPFCNDARKHWLTDQPLAQDVPPADDVIPDVTLLEDAINDAPMEFAAALITLSGPHDAHREHAQRAIAGAKGDPLLTQNLASRFTGPQSETMSELLAKTTISN
jgi:hypothetical protein